MDCSLPGSSIHGIFQARVLEWVAMTFSSSFKSGDHTQVFRIAGSFFTIWATREAQNIEGPGLLWLWRVEMGPGSKYWEEGNVLGMEEWEMVPNPPMRIWAWRPPHHIRIPWHSTCVHGLWNVVGNYKKKKMCDLNWGFVVVFGSRKIVKTHGKKCHM